MSDAERTRCQGTTQAGERCRRSARPGSSYCHLHGPAEPAAPVSPPVEIEVETVAPNAAERAALRRRLAAELDGVVARLQAAQPEFEPPPFSATAVVDMIRQALAESPELTTIRETLASASRDDLRDPETWKGLAFIVSHSLRYQGENWRDRLRQALEERLPPDWQQKMHRAVDEALFDSDTWRGLWYMIHYSLQFQAERLEKRRQGEYETDEWGLDWEFVDATRPFFTFLYRLYWRVEASGLDHVPEAGPALLVANHSGQLPFDAAMVGTAIMLDHPSQRLVRSLYGDWFPSLPFVSALLSRLGQVLATVDNGTRLLQNDELVAVFPEGYKGAGKLYRERYRLARFGRGGFVKMALRTGAPIIPVAIVGAEETYISLHKSKTLAQLTGFPFFPITPTFPWLGPLGTIPLPTKWWIDFGPPIPVAGYGPAAADDLLLVSRLTEEVRAVVQAMVNERLAQRPSLFFS